MSKVDMIRGSEGQSFQRCRLRWKYQWVDELVKKKPNNKLYTGTLIHKFLEVLYLTNNPEVSLMSMRDVYESTTGLDEAEAMEIWELAENVCRHYVSNWGEHDLQYKTVGAEVKFMMPLEEGVMFTGTMDLILEDKDGRLWLLDHKTTTTIDKYVKIADMDRQISRYLFILKKMTDGLVKVEHEGEWIVPSQYLGKEVGGFLYNIIKKEVPQPPQVLKSGKFSTNKSAKTTYDLFFQAIHEKAKEISDDVEETLSELMNEYADYLELLKEKDETSPYFKRLEVIRSDDELEASIDEFTQVAKEAIRSRQLLEKGKDKHIYRHITGDCQWDCDYKELCKASMDGSNASLVKAALYTTKEEV